MRFKEFLESNGFDQFTTDKGSVYQYANGKTIRNKAIHPFHDLGDHGVKDQSELTVFVQPELAREIGMWQTSSAQKKRVILANGTIALVSLNPVQGRHGLDRTQAVASYTLQPSLGLCPLELFQRDNTPWPWLKPGMQVFAGSHPGSPIVQFGTAQKIS